MANRFAVASGNFNDTATWSTTAAGAPGASVPVAGDNAIANNRTVTITANATCDNVTNGTTYGGTAGGGFVLSNGVTLTANVIGGAGGSCVSLTGANSAAIVGNVSNLGGAASIIVVNNSSTGALTLTSVNISNSVSNAGNQGVQNSGTGSINITVSGTITGGSASGNFGVNNNSTGAVTISGNVTSGSAAAGVNNASTGTVTILGTITAGAVPAFTSSSAGATNRLSGSFIHSSTGIVPIYAQKFTLDTTPLAAKTRYALNGAGAFVDMFTADNTGLAPAVTDVRAGVVYGSATGVLAVPAANSVAFGVPVDNTTGTAVLTPAAIRAELATELGRIDAAISSRLAPSGTLATVTTLTNAPASVTASDIWSYATRTVTGGTVDTLTNAPSVPSASAIASQVRTELSVELARIDAATSTRATPANIPTSDITAIKAKTDALNTTRLAQVSTTEIVGNLLAQANS